MSFWTRGETGNVVSWGSTNFYSTLLAGITPASAVVQIGSESPEITGFQTFAAAHTPGLKSCRATISGFMGATPYMGNGGLLAYSSGGYALHVPSWTWNASCSTVDDITEFSSGSAPQWRSFMPGYFRNTCNFVAGIDSATALALPPDTGASLPTVTLTYKSGATLAASAIITNVGANIARGQKNTAQIGVQFTGTTAAVGGPFGTSRTFGSTANTDPLWSAGGSAVGALVIQAASGRTYSFADSFWETMTIGCNVGAPVTFSCTVRGTGTLTVA